MHHGGKPNQEPGGQKLRQRPWSNAVYWLTLPGSLSYFPYTPQAHLSRNGTIHSVFGPPTPIRNYENAPTNRPLANSMEAILHFRFPGDSNLCKVDKKLPRIFPNPWKDFRWVTNFLDANFENLWEFIAFVLGRKQTHYISFYSSIGLGRRPAFLGRSALP